MAKRSGLWGVAAVAGGVVAGAALERLLYRRLVDRPDPEEHEPIGSVPGRTQWVESFDGAKLYARVFGNEDADVTLVFAHGIIEQHIIWHYQIRDFTRDGRYRIVAYDHRGHGSSGPVRGPQGKTPFSGATLARDFMAVVAQTSKDSDVVGIGHSLGGMTALAMLTDREIEREKIRGVALVNSTFTAQLGGWREDGHRFQQIFERMGAVAQRVIGEDAKLIDRLKLQMSDLVLLLARLVFGKSPSKRHLAVAYHMYETVPAQTLAAAIDLQDYDLYEELLDIDVPILIVAGTHDLLTPAFLSRAMAARIPGAELVMLEDCGHMSPFERHDELSAQLRKFAERVTS